MADETQGTDNAQAPEPSQPETTGAGTASGSQSQHDAIAALRSEYDAKIAAVQKQADNAARFVHQRDTELSRLRQENARLNQGYERQDAQGYETPAQPVPDITSARLGMLEFKQAHPDWRERLTELQEAAQDPVFGERFGTDLNSRVTFEAAYEVAERRRLERALDEANKAKVELDAMKTKQKSAQETLKSHAFVSGMGTSEPPQSIDPAELAKMTPEEMEKKYGKAVLLRGVH